MASTYVHLFLHLSLIKSEYPAILGELESSIEVCPAQDVELRVRSRASETGSVRPHRDDIVLPVDLPWTENG